MAKKINVVNNVLEQGVHYLQSPFGKREYPKGVITQHNGDDLTGKNGADWIVAIDKGVITKYEYTDSRGYYIEMRMKNGYLTRYLHTKEDTCQVKVGQQVTKGQRLAYMGNTGYYKDAEGKKHRVGTHLHFAVVNKSGTFVDPMPYLQGKKDFEVFEPGQYIVIYDKYLRTSPEVKSNNKVIWKSLYDSWKAITHKDAVGKARMNSGVVVRLIDFKTDKKGNIWGRCLTDHTPIWICVKDKTGNQVRGV